MLVIIGWLWNRTENVTVRVFLIEIVLRVSKGKCSRRWLF